MPSIPFLEADCSVKAPRFVVGHRKAQQMGWAGQRPQTRTADDLVPKVAKEVETRSLA